MGDSGLVAVIERKSFSNLLKDVSDLRILHQSLDGLQRYPIVALLVSGVAATVHEQKALRQPATVDDYCPISTLVE